MMPKSITVGELLNNEHYVQVTGDEKSLERPIYVAEINRPGFELALRLLEKKIFQFLLPNQQQGVFQLN